MFSRLHTKVGIVFTLSKTIISDLWTQSALTHTVQCSKLQCSALNYSAPSYSALHLYKCFWHLIHCNMLMQLCTEDPHMHNRNWTQFSRCWFWWIRSLSQFQNCTCEFKERLHEWFLTLIKQTQSTKAPSKKKKIPTFDPHIDRRHSLGKVSLAPFCSNVADHFTKSDSWHS